MNCFYHTQQEAVAQCSVCSKGLCFSCAPQVAPPTCITCYNSELKSARAEIIKELLMTYGFGLVATILLIRAGILGFDGSFVHINVITSIIAITIFLLYIASGIVAGWKTLTGITPQVFLFLPLLGWVLYFLVKLILAFFVGLVMLPIRTVVCIIRLNKLKIQK